MAGRARRTCRVYIASPPPRYRRHKLPRRAFSRLHLRSERPLKGPTTPKRAERVRKRNRDYRSGRVISRWRRRAPFDRPPPAAILSLRGMLVEPFLHPEIVSRMRYSSPMSYTHTRAHVRTRRLTIETLTLISRLARDMIRGDTCMYI